MVIFPVALKTYHNTSKIMYDGIPTEGGDLCGMGL